jgi:nucleotide-binding universal stress UspA family protein
MHRALIRGAEVAVVAAYPTLAYWSGADIVDVSELDAVRHNTWARAGAAVDAVRDSDTAIRDVPVRLHVEPGPAAAHLVRHSTDADLLVVGSSSRGAVGSAPLGSVALHSVSAAECPVAVVPLPGRWAQPQPGSCVVVGVDDSERSAAALSAALTEAGPSGSVTVVRAEDGADLWGDQYPVVSGPSQRRLRDDASRRVAATLGALLVATTDESPTIQRLAHRAQAGPVLVELAADADLLVVASRGHGEFPGLVFGSVALHCVVHAPCPVLVVRPITRQSASQSTLDDSAASR